MRVDEDDDDDGGDNNSLNDNKLPSVAVITSHTRGYLSLELGMRPRARPNLNEAVRAFSR